MTIPIKIINKQEYLKNNSKPKQETVWDSISVPWEKYTVKTLFIIEEFLKNKKGKIIDIGCGSGRNMIKNNNIEYYSVDFSSKQLENAKKYATEHKVNAKFFKSGANNLSVFSNEMFDSGIFIATLHCLETKKERKDSLNELYRVLKKDAEAIISVWNSDDERFNSLLGDVYMNWRDQRKEYFRYYYLYEKNDILN